MFLRDAWYVAARSDAIQQSLTPIKILGEDIVLYRQSDGVAVALEDACPHRKMPLSMGQLNADCVQCGYHGLVFDRTGCCVSAPTQSLIPANAKVYSYPLVERYGLLWIWMGDRANAAETSILSVPDYEDPAWGLTEGGVLEIQCHYLYLMDNLLDPSHVAWVHRTSFASAGTEQTPLDIEDTPTGMLVSRWIKDISPPPYYAAMLKFEGNVDRLQYYQAVLPSIAINKSTYAPSGTGGPDRELPDQTYYMRSYHFMTPIDERSTRYHWFQHYNTDVSDEAVRKKLNDGARSAFEEDRVVLEAVQRGMDNKRSRNIDLRLDAGARLFRRKLDALIAATQSREPTALT